MAKNNFISLSPSKLNVFQKCPRCFWLAQNAKVNTPRGIFPTLPNGVDRAMKAHHDQYRGSLPPYLKGHLPGVLHPDQAWIDKLRQWQTGLKPKCEYRGQVVGLIMALDDLLLLDEAGPVVAPLDNKSKGDQPETSGAEYYQLQLEIYALALEEVGLVAHTEGYLNYVWPSIQDGLDWTFGCTVYAVEVSIAHAQEVIFQAVDCLLGPCPEAMPNCEYCGYVAALKQVEAVAV